MAHQNVFRTREGGGAKPLVTLSPQTTITRNRIMNIMVLYEYSTRMGRTHAGTPDGRANDIAQGRRGGQEGSYSYRCLIRYSVPNLHFKL